MDCTVDLGNGTNFSNTSTQIW